MDDPLLTALHVSAVGMAALFAALLFLYGLMYLMTALIRQRTPAPPAPAQSPPGDDAAALAAAIAVALARASSESAPPSSAATDDAPSPWRTFHHYRQLGLKRRG